MRILGYIIAFLVLLAIQVAVLPYVTLGDFAPDILLIGIIILGIRDGGVAAMITGSFAGLGRDILSSKFLGVTMLALVVAGFLAGIYKKNSQRLGLRGNLVFLFSIVFIYHAILYLLFFLDTKQGVFNILLGEALPAALYTLILIGIAHFLMPRGLWGRNK